MSAAGLEGASLQKVTTQGLKRRRRFVILFIFFLVALYSVRRAIFDNLLPADLAVGLALQVSLTTFCIVDSRCRGKPLLHSFCWIIFFTWPFSVPVYWVWTRGLKGVLTGTLVLLTFMIVSVIAYVAAAYGIGQEPWLY